VSTGPARRTPDPGAKPEDHYSYTVYADPAMADQFDRARFSGPIGELLAATQARILLEYAGPNGGGAVLDVGTGTGRAALVLAEGGAQVTAVDASAEMLRVAEARAQARGARIAFGIGDAHHLAFDARAFDTVVSLRVLMHTPDWRQCVAEACRVARRQVIVDYPAATSVAAIQSAARRVAHGLGARTEPYRVFTDRQIREEFARHGFRVTREHRQFVLPIAVHKRLNSRALTDRVERALARLGLLAVAGSPVTILAQR
jgi:ubiquinone/menaquinone biosynthesis C-methylase UbiE